MLWIHDLIPKFCLQAEYDNGPKGIKTIWYIMFVSLTESEISWNVKDKCESWKISFILSLDSCLYCQELSVETTLTSPEPCRSQLTIYSTYNTAPPPVCTCSVCVASRCVACGNFLHFLSLSLPLAQALSLHHLARILVFLVEPCVCSQNDYLKRKKIPNICEFVMVYIFSLSCGYKPDFSV